ncbi:MAG: SDR family NAD(P)-dependent oxidoreductase [Yoonia sp.]|nr:SDR family NAD(P)-dependent oxidoreductase [Yoonia sp.]
MTTLITGANRGIGAALLAKFQMSDQDALGTSRQTDDLLDLDVTDARSFERLSKALNGRPIKHLICNAGVFGDKGMSLDKGYTPDIWVDTFAANVTGVFQTIQTILPNLRAATDAKIMIISSQMGSSERAQGGAYAYRASKAAVTNLGRNLAIDLKPEGIAVGIYHPGWVQTDMGGSAAAITVDDSVNGLYDRISALSIATTGCFETWDGRMHPF